MEKTRPWWRQATGRPPWIPNLGERKVSLILAVGYALAALVGLAAFLVSHNGFQLFTPCLFAVLAVGWLWRAHRLPH